MVAPKLCAQPKNIIFCLTKCRDEVVDNIYPQIIPVELFQKVGARLEKNRYGKRSFEATYLLKFKAKCGYCGMPMYSETGTASNGETNRYYKCAGKKKYHNGCTKSQVRKEYLEDIVVNAIIDELNRPGAIESKLIVLAETAGTLDSDNKKKGNPQKVDEFRQAELEQYLEEALFLLDLIGVRVFKKTKRVSSKALGIESKSIVVSAAAHNETLPPLPNNDQKIGSFVYEAMQRLSDCGFTFTPQQIDEMTTPQWSMEHFHTQKPFMKRYIPGQTDNKGTDGYIRFKSQPYTFGTIQVYVSKEWYEPQRKYFIDWYNSL